MKDLDLFIIRHAIAEADQGLGDAARALTPKGRREFWAHIRKLADRVAVVGIATSPAVRAVQTAEMVALACKIDRVVVRAELDNDSATPESIAGLLDGLKGSWAVVGHNPSLAEALARLLGLDQPEFELKKGAVAALRRRKSAWTLRWYAAPGAKLLRGPGR